jgi:alpha-N-acetylglucosamine transferase
MATNKSKIRLPKFAYGTFIFKDSGYLPGLLMTAYKIKRMNSSGDIKLICLYTPDVDSQILEVLKLIYDDVRCTEYLKFGRDRNGRQQPLPFMFTRFRFLELTEFDKILVLDSDMLPLKNYDQLFELTAPAGVINETKDRMKGVHATIQPINEWEWHDFYKTTAAPGDIIKKSITDKPLKKPEENMGINGGLMLLKPSEEDFARFCAWCKKPDLETVINKMNWPDMQTITAYYSGNWTSIDASYLGLYGYPNIASLNGVHFIGPKPWQHRHKNFEYRIKNYPDYRLWSEEYIQMCKDMPELLDYKPLKNLFDKISVSL